MKTHKVSKDFDQKFLALWQQCIDSKKKEIEYCKKEKNKDMYDFNVSVLKRMKEDYEQVKSKIAKAS